MNPVKASLMMAQSLVKMKLSHSKKAYPSHPNKIFISIRQIYITILIYPHFIFFLNKL